MEKIIKLAVFGLDGHGPGFAHQVNTVMTNARVVKAMPYPTAMVDENKLALNIESTRNDGVEIVGDIAQLTKDVDGVLVLQDDGSQHLEMAGQLVACGKPVYVDKPIEVTAAKAQALLELYRKHNCPLFSGSALRYTPEIKAVKADAESGAILGAMTWSPYMQNPRMPGWIYYAIHAVEPLFELLGPGCVDVRCVPGQYGPTAIGRWADGRTGIARAAAGGVHGYGFTVWREKKTVTTTVAMDTIYQGLLDAIVDFFRTGVAPTPVESEVEVVAFMEKANADMKEIG
ncbi:MAG: Gfo/Idh/MocA family oxidoreductase [Lentisphaerota bacterium]